MTEFDFLLADRIQKIKQMYADYDLENRSYISFSGGKDSTVLSKLFDLAIPENQIPRVYINTGIDYRAIVDFVKEYGKRDGRLEIIQPPQNIRTMLETDGCPFNVELQRQLDVLEGLLPSEKKRAEYLWKPVYDEYRRIEYRLRPLGLFD